MTSPRVVELPRALYTQAVTRDTFLDATPISDYGKATQAELVRCSLQAVPPAKPKLL